MESSNSPCKPSKTAGELSRLARTAVGQSVRMAKLTPLFPDHWPERGSPVIFAYQSEPLPTGRVATRIHSPSQRVVFSADGVPTLESIPNPTVLGEQVEGGSYPSDFSARLEAAQDALLQVIAGCQPAESVRDAFRPYQTWLSHNSLVASDLQGRVGPFLDWLRSNR
jgi:hypothetical protein